MTSSIVCADCQTKPSELDIRRRRLCRDCFMRYVSSKVLKRMETYRFKNLVDSQPRKLLLPLSGGPSSLALLHILNAQLKRQRDKQGRTAYDLVLVHVLPPIDNESSAGMDWRAAIPRIFPEHRVLELYNIHDVFVVDDQIEQNLLELGVVRRTGEDNDRFLIRVLSSLKTTTARVDFQDILLQRLLVGLARKEGCEGILWGHSDSRLAAKVLADVAKGRGGSVSAAIADGTSPHGLEFTHPIRDLFLSELELYLDCILEDVTDCRLTERGEMVAPVSVRNTAIDNLLTQYINSQGEKYPSIMANVVRTAGKLQMPTLAAQAGCSFCVMQMASDGLLCYGCERMKQDIKN